jgi:hypothetical protein
MCLADRLRDGATVKGLDAAEVDHLGWRGATVRATGTVSAAVMIPVPAAAAAATR